MSNTSQQLIQQILKYQYTNIDKMYQCCLKLAEIGKEENDDYAMCFASNYITDYYYSSKTHFEALGKANQNLAFNEEKQINELLMTAYNLYGVIVCNEDYSLALSYYLKALTIAKEINDVPMLFKLYGNIGDVFCNLEEYDMALQYCLKALDYIELIDQNDPIHNLRKYIILYIADIYCETDEHDESLALLMDNANSFNKDISDAMNYLFASVYIKILYHNKEVEKCISIIDDILTHEIQGFRNNEINYLVHKRMFHILLELRDEKRIKRTLMNLQNNDFIHTGIKYQLEFLQMQIDAEMFTDDSPRLNRFYAEYYRMSRIEKQKNQDFCLDSVLYKIELYREQSKKEDILRLSSKDELTNLYNRRIFNRDFHYLNETASSIGIILFDLDEFKHYNDNFGHLYGDHILKAFGNCLAKEHPFIRAYRFGGDEFICLTHNTTENDIICYIEDIYNSFNCEDTKQVTLSCGYYQMPKNDLLDKEDLIRKADEYLYKVKNQGKNAFLGFVET